MTLIVSLLTILLFASNAEAQHIAIQDTEVDSAEVFMPMTDILIEDEIGARILFVAAREYGSRVQITSAIEIENVSDEISYIALIGPEPSAFDENGNIYEISRSGWASGLSWCRWMSHASHIKKCLENDQDALPASFFSMLQPGSATVMTLTLGAPSGTLETDISISFNLAASAGNRPSSGKRHPSSLQYLSFTFQNIKSEVK